MAQVVKDFTCNAGNPGSISGSERAPGEENGYPLQYSCLENSVSRGDCRSKVHGVAELDVTEHSHTHTEIKFKLQSH